MLGSYEEMVNYKAHHMKHGGIPKLPPHNLTIRHDVAITNLIMFVKRSHDSNTFSDFIARNGLQLMPVRGVIGRMT
ncbi:hypothetical protein AKJ16_DCAP05137 [Drosera capensis]